MAKKKTIEQIAQKFQKDTQKIVDESKGRITSISIEADGEKFTIAKKKKPKS